MRRLPIHRSPAHERLHSGEPIPLVGGRAGVGWVGRAGPCLQQPRLISANLLRSMRFAHGKA